jgi:UDP-2,3-diacylglucosamine hydrolase
MTDEYLFISDCHLDGNRPEVTTALATFLEKRATSARCLYILGDLFEVWLGDDDAALEQNPVLTSLQQLAINTDIFFMAGNRDFLLGQDFADRIGISIVTEPLPIKLGDQQALLIHGDTLCTDDHDYQAFRKMVREPEWKAEFLSKPLTERHQIAAQLRQNSVSAMAQKSMDIMDVNQQAVEQCFDDHAIDIIVHGHTHRPAVHHYPENRIRYVLGDWNPGPSYLSWRTNHGFNLVDSRVP